MARLSIYLQAFALALVSSATLVLGDTEHQASARTPLTVGIAGCSVVRVGRVCEVPGNTAQVLTFWFPGASRGEQPQVSLDDRTAECQPSRWVDAVEGVPDSGIVVSCTVRADGPGMLALNLNGRISLLQLAVTMRWPWQTELGTLTNQKAIERLNTLIPSLQDGERGRALSALAVRLTAVGDWRKACATLAESATLAEQLGRYSESRHRWLVCAYQASEHYDFELARTSIMRASDSRWADLGLVDVEREAFVAYAWSFFHTKLGQYARAAAAYEQTIAWSQRGAAELGERSAVGLAHLAAEKGRYAEAVSRLVDVLAGPLAKASPCFQATVLHNLGRQELNAHWSQLGSDPWLVRAEEHLREATALVGGPCPTADASEKAWIQLELGFVAWHHRDLATARRLWTRAGAEDGDGYYWAWRTILDAELALAEGDSAKAMREFANLARFGEATLRLPMQWRASEGLARVHVAQDEWELAIENFRHAEQILTESERDISVENGLLGFTSGKLKSAQGLVAALMHQGRVREAFDVARLARRRTLAAADSQDGVSERLDEQTARAEYVTSRDALARSVQRSHVAPLTEATAIEQQIGEQRAAHQVALERLLNLRRAQRTSSTPPVLRSPDLDEVLLLWFPTGDAWHGFAQSHTELASVTTIDPRGAEWLAPLTSLARPSQRVTVLGFGKLQDEAVHLLPFEGAPLYERFDVTYGLDLNPRQPRRHDATHVLLAADAQGDLPLATAEAKRLEQLYAQHRVAVSSLVGARLGAPAFRHALESATLLHFAGHGHLAGTEGWDSWLALADETRFTAGDILALPRVPQVVVLNACEAAASRDLTKGPGLGLAHAWILAGTDTVIAPTQVISDRDSYRFAEVFAEALITSSGSTARAYRAALAAAHTAYRMTRP